MTTYCKKCGGAIDGGHERDGSQLCWCPIDDEEYVEPLPFKKVLAFPFIFGYNTVYAVIWGAYAMFLALVINVLISLKRIK